MGTYYGNIDAREANAKYDAYGIMYEVSNGKVVAFGFEGQEPIWKAESEG